MKAETILYLSGFSFVINQNMNGTRTQYIAVRKAFLPGVENLSPVVWTVYATKRMIPKTEPCHKVFLFIFFHFLQKINDIKTNAPVNLKAKSVKTGTLSRVPFIITNEAPHTRVAPRRASLGKTVLMVIKSFS